MINIFATFQHYIDKYFADYLNIFIFVYLNDIFIYSINDEKHTKHVRMVLLKLGEYNLYVRVCHPILTWPITACVLYNDQSRKRPRIWLSSYQYKKNQRLDDIK